MLVIAGVRFFNVSGDGKGEEVFVICSHLLGDVTSQILDLSSDVA